MASALLVTVPGPILPASVPVKSAPVPAIAPFVEVLASNRNSSFQMKFNISGFTDLGTVRRSNQDRIFTNRHRLSEGAIHLEDQPESICFVADGVGGNNGGDFAADFVLEKLASLDKFHSVREELLEANRQLIASASCRPELAGAATTLTGLIVCDDVFDIVHVGDSQMWLFRDDTFFKVTNDQTFDEFESNSPLVSYFGGRENSLNFDRSVFVTEAAKGDLFLICSDGLPKALDHRSIKTILSESISLPQRLDKLRSECLERGAEDNVSVILINKIE